MAFFRTHSLEIQFWGYELGNVVAAIAGAGGLSHLAGSIERAVAGAVGPVAAVASLFTDFPEAASTLGVIALVVLSVPVAMLARRIAGAVAGEAVSALAVPLALGLLVYAMLATASPFTVSACAFVAASCLLRGGGAFPILLKLGGLCLSFGGVALGLAALSLPTDTTMAAGLAISTGFAGFYVAGAGLLTYRGGCAAIAAGRPHPSARTPLAAALHPTTGPVARLLGKGADAVIGATCRTVVLPSILWASAETKATRPFYLSMQARLPWRGIAMGFGLATGTEIGVAFALANALWALGDIAIGALDAPARSVRAPGLVMR